MAPWKGTEPTLQQGPATLWQSLRGEEGWRPPPTPWQPPQGTQARWAREGAGLWPAGGTAPGSSGVGGTLAGGLHGAAWGVSGTERSSFFPSIPALPTRHPTPAGTRKHRLSPWHPLPSPLLPRKTSHPNPKTWAGSSEVPVSVPTLSGARTGRPTGAPRVPTFSLAENGDPGLVGVPGSESSSSSRTLSRYPMASSSSSMACRAPLGLNGGPHKATAGKAYAAEPARPDSALDAGHSFGMKGAIMGSPVLPPAPSAPLRGAPWAVARPPERDGGTTRAGG